jgi:hypothetical protein
MFVVIAGNVIDGSTVYGPFQDSDEAVEVAETFLSGEDWLVTEVEEVVGYEHTMKFTVKVDE